MTRFFLLLPVRLHWPKMCGQLDVQHALNCAISHRALAAVVRWHFTHGPDPFRRCYQKKVVQRVKKDFHAGPLPCWAVMLNRSVNVKNGSTTSEFRNQYSIKYSSKLKPRSQNDFQRKNKRNLKKKNRQHFINMPISAIFIFEFLYVCL